MKCGFCGYDLDPEEAQPACAGCPLHQGGCGMIRCPRCGYEMPPEAKLITWLRGVRDRWRSQASVGGDSSPSR